ncbi:MAG: transcription termination factor Rho [Acidimicrobiia bacterium]|nr:transcription termination factor Rho [Acidimicrobiia bacterium]
MSLDAHELERAALQKKDREQLIAISAAMGRKAPARLRKSQIIDLIMELAGEPQAAAAADAASAGEAGTTGSSAESAPAPKDVGGSPPDVEQLSLPDSDDGEDSTVSGDEAAGGKREGNAEGSAAGMVASGAEAPRRPSEAASADGRSERRARFVFSPDASGGTRRDASRPVTRPDRPERRAEDGRPGESRDRSEARDAREQRPNREQRDGRDSREVREQREGRDTRDGRDSREVREQREGRDTRDGRDSREVREQREGRDTREGREAAAAGRGGRDAERDGGRSDAEDDGDNDGDASGRRRRRRNKNRDRADAVPEDAALGEQVEVSGYLDLRDEGYGFLRLNGYMPSRDDVYIPSKFVRQYSLRKGDQLVGTSRPAGRGEKNPALLRLDSINGDTPEAARDRPNFEQLTPLFPDERLRLERDDRPYDMTARIIDLLAPIGKGQRGLIVSPPKAGKTTIMKQIAQAIEANNPDVVVMMLLVDERPEEVTDMARSISGEVVASTFDRPAEEHTQIAEMTIERAKRMVERGLDVVLIVDGITRLARAYNLAVPTSGRVMSGGMDTGAIYPPKRFFGAARNVEEGGSLTILATALVETGSRMDEVIFEEFKGTGNMELRLDRHLAEKRIYPAIDVDASSTRHEELLFEARQLQQVWKLRRVLGGLSDGGSGAAIEMLADRMRHFRSNDEFLAEMAKAPSA